MCGVKVSAKSVRESAIWDDIWKEGDCSTGLSGSLSKRLLRGKDVLELGCGALGASVGAKVAKKFTGMDISNEALRKASRVCNGHSLVHGDARALPFKDNSFDIVVAIEMPTLLGLDLFAAFEEMARVTREKVVFTVTHLDVCKEDMHPDTYATVGGALFSNGFSDIIALSEPMVVRVLKMVGLKPKKILVDVDEDGVKQRLYVEAVKR